jgi:hypothetical protein
MFTSPLHRNVSSSIVVCLFISAVTCLSSLCLAMSVYSGSRHSDFRPSCHNISDAPLDVSCNKGSMRYKERTCKWGYLFLVYQTEGLPTFASGRKEMKFPQRCIPLGILGDGQIQKPSNVKCNVPSSEPFRKGMWLMILCANVSRGGR